MSTLNVETKTRLNDLADPAGCVAFAKSHLVQLERHTCSPPADLVRILQEIAQVPDQSVILKERFEFVQEGARGHDKIKRQTVRWRNAGIRLQPRVPANLNNGKSANKDTFAIAPILPSACRARGSPALLEWRCTSCSTRHKIVPRFLFQMPFCRKALLRTFPNFVRMADKLWSIPAVSMLATAGSHRTCRHAFLEVTPRPHHIIVHGIGTAAAGKL